MAVHQAQSCRDAGLQVDGRRDARFEFSVVSRHLVCFSALSPLLDLAAMRQVVHHYGGDPQVVHPAVPVDIMLEGVLGSSGGQGDGLSVTELNEFLRCEERFLFLKWAAHAFREIRLVPPGTDMLHSALLQHLARWVVQGHHGSSSPDVVIGVDSHLAIFNGLGILALGEMTMTSQRVSGSSPPRIFFHSSKTCILVNS